jgi:hypothetical protein
MKVLETAYGSHSVFFFTMCFMFMSEVLFDTEIPLPRAPGPIWLVVVCYTQAAADVDPVISTPLPGG